MADGTADATRSAADPSPGESDAPATPDGHEPDGPAADDRSDDDERRSADDGADGSGPRSVVVPDRVYKTVTVFSTLFAVVTVVVGFVVLDEATQRASVALSDVDPVLALLGLGLIALGAVTYAFSTRFRAAGMGNAKDDTDEDSSNG